MTLGFSANIHGDSGVGKTWLMATMPAPRLVIDVEGRTRWTPLGRKVEWNPYEAIPAGEWDTAVVKLREYAPMAVVYQWLASGQHPFRSVGIDSITELQKRIIDSIAGSNAMETQNWGDLLRKLETLVRQFRDLVEHPTNPLDLVLFTSFTHEKSGKLRPLLQGQLGLTLPFYVDVNGYLSVCPDPADPALLARCLQIQPTPTIVAKDGTDALTRHYGSVVINPNFAEMLRTLNTEPSNLAA